MVSFNEKMDQVSLEFFDLKIGTVSLNFRNTLSFHSLVPILHLLFKLVQSEAFGVVIHPLLCFQLTARSLPAVQSDERLQPLLNHLR